MALLEMLAFLFGLVCKLWMLGAVFCFYTFVDIFASIPLAVFATIGIIFAFLFLCWAAAKGIYG